MKKLFLLTVLSLFTALTNRAQESTAFEGEIVYETYEQYSDYLLKMPQSIYFNGVHRVRLIVKGDMMHMIDETTGCHIIADNAAAKAIMNHGSGRGKNNQSETSRRKRTNAYTKAYDKAANNGNALSNLAANRRNGGAVVHFCDHTKTGLDMSDAPGIMYILGACDISYATGQKAPLKSNTFAKTDETLTIMEQNCPLYAGRIVRSMGGMDQTYDVKTWVSEELPASEGYKRWRPL